MGAVQWLQHITPLGYLITAIFTVVPGFIKRYGNRLREEGKQDSRQDGRYVMVTRRSNRLLRERLKRREWGAIIYLAYWVACFIMVITAAWWFPLMFVRQ